MQSSWDYSKAPPCSVLFSSTGIELLSACGVFNQGLQEISEAYSFAQRTCSLEWEIGSRQGSDVLGGKWRQTLGAELGRRADAPR